MAKLLTVVTVSHNSSHILPDFFNTLGSSEAIRVLVIDSGSRDVSIAEEISKKSDAEFIRVKENVGFGRASNIGAQHTKTPWVAFVNPDTLIGGDELLALAQLCHSKNASAIGPTITDKSGSMQSPLTSHIRPPLSIFSRSHNKILETRGLDDSDAVRVAAVSGCCLVIRLEDFRRLGGFDERFFMFAEELDLQFRLAEAGSTVIMARNISAVTEGGASSLGTTSRWSETQREVSHVVYVQKHFGPLNGFLDLLFRIGRILMLDSYKPRPVSLRQFFRGLRTALPLSRR